MSKRKKICLTLTLEGKEAETFESLKEKLGTSFDTETVRVAFKRLEETLSTT